MVLQSSGTKVVKALGQIGLAWFLVPQDFGLIGLAYTLTACVELSNTAGVRDVLIQRQDDFKRWANSAFWLQLLLSAVLGVVLAGAAPLVASLYKAPQVQGLIWVLSATIVVNAFSVVPSAQLRGQMRFRTVALIDLVNDVSVTALSVFLAWRGFGAYSFVWPPFIAAIIRALVLWRLCDVRFSLHPERHLWRPLLADSLPLYVAILLINVVNQGDYMMLGLKHSPETVGLYYFAFVLSLQTTQLLSGTLSTVLFPALSQLKGAPEQQQAAIERAIRTMALVGVPICLLQVALADPAIRLLFEPKWYGSILLLQILSLGNGLRFPFWFAYSIFRAQGRFVEFTKFCLWNALLFFPLVALGVFWGGAPGVAAAVALFSALSGVWSIQITLKPRGSWRESASVCAAPFLVGMVSVAAAMLVMRLIPAPTKVGHALRLLVACGTCAVVYIPLIRYLMPSEADVVAGHLRRFLPKKRSDAVAAG